MVNIYEQVDRNKNLSNLIVVGFSIFTFLIIYLFITLLGFDSSYVSIALIFTIITSIGSYYASDKIVLALSNAKEASREEYFDFYTVTENLSMAAQMPMPKIYVIEDTAMNAFATGRDPSHAVICATTGLLQKLNRSELEGVIAHELSHIRNFDIRLMTIVAIMVGSITLLADWFLRVSFWGGSRNRDRNNDNQSLSIILAIVGVILVLLSPLIANLIKLAISRRREFLADASGVELTKYPESLASALEKISGDHEVLEVANKATAHLYISDPLKNQSGSIHWFANLFSTHPPVEERIKALRSMR